MKGAALWATAVFAFSIPFENAVAIAGIGSLARLIGVLAVAVVAISLFDDDRIRLRAPSIQLIVAILYVLWNGLSYFWSIVPQVSIGGSTTLLQLLVMLWLINQVGHSERRLDVLAQSFVFGAYVTILMAFAAFYETGGEGFRQVGSFNPNWFAIGLAFTIPLAWGLMLRARRPLFVWVNALFPLFAVAALVISASRGGFVTALVALSVIPLTFPRISLFRRILVLGVFATAIGGALVFAPRNFPQLQQNIERLGTTAGEVAGDGTFTGRTNIWAEGLQAFSESPIVGYGVNGFRYAVEEAFGRPRAAHNAFLSVAVGSGLIGLLLFMSIIVIPLVGILATPDRRAELLVLVMTLIVGMSPANLEHTKAVWFLLGWLAVSRPIAVSLSPHQPPSRAHLQVKKDSIKTRPASPHRVT